MMLDLDVEQFWKDDAESHKENCFSPGAPQVALGIRMSDECVFAELGEEGKPWGDTPRERRLELNKRYNDRAEKIVGKRLLREELPEENAVFPPFRQIGEIFGGQYLFEGGSWWLKGIDGDEKELEALLDRIDKMNLREFILPANWEQEKKRIYEQYGKKPTPFNSVRGPVTLASSIYGVEKLIFLLFDEPDLGKRFSETILKVILGYIDIFAEESGKAPFGFHFYDDDCQLLTVDMYEQFGFPVLKKIFDYTAAEPGAPRYQHSDSAMGHLLPILGRLNLTGCNFGPTLTISEIRKHMPHTRIDGQLAPFTFMNNCEKDILTEVRRDCEMAQLARGVNLTTAGSINNGSLLTSMRAVMAGIQNYGRYSKLT